MKKDHEMAKTYSHCNYYQSGNMLNLVCTAMPSRGKGTRDTISSSES